MLRKFNFRAIILVLMLSICTILSACSSSNKNYKIQLKDSDIAYLTLCSYSGEGESNYGLISFGHTFLAIENISNEPIIVYNYEIKSGETITISTWSLSEHFGVWFNVESNYILNHDKYNGRYSITTGISSDDISTINSFINKNDKWSILRNCSYFALSLWNEVAEESEYISRKPIFTPSYIQEEIIKFESYEKNKEIATTDSCYYYNNEQLLEFHFK